MLTLQDSTEAVFASNDDIDAAPLTYCSRITATLPPGTYYVSVQGNTALRYRLAGQAGS